MAIQIEECVLIETGLSEVTSDSVNIQEGAALVHVLEGGVRKLALSKGVAGEIFAGVSLNMMGAITVAPLVEEVVVPNSTGVVTLSKPLSGTAIRVSQGTTEIVVGNPGTTAGQYSRTGQVLTFNTAQRGQTVRIAYNYIVSAREAQFIFGQDFLASDDVSDILNCGYVTTGVMVTSCYDVTSDWASFSTTTPIRLGANGLFTLSGSGVTIDAIVEAVPSVNNGMLGIRLQP